MTDRTKHIYVVTGPTASGKSDFAVTLALSKKNNVAPYLDGEIISCDSRQVYKGLNIGTGKITEEEMRGVPHHMLSVYDATDDSVSVVQFMCDALPIIENIFARGKTPILCGGTGFYIDALIYTQKFPEVTQNQELRKELSGLSLEALQARLQNVDPEYFETVDIHNRVRLIRAIEIAEAIGKVPAREENELRYKTTLYLLSPDRNVLREKIHNRLLSRLEHGMLEEIQNLYNKGLSYERMESLGLEYRYGAYYLQEKMDKEQMITELEQKIGQYAKRQETWNKRYEKDTQIEVIDATK
jgi:tRNA dimethylallyltransferase